MTLSSGQSQSRRTVWGVAAEHDPLDALSITDVVVVPATHDDGEWADGGPAGDPPVQLLPDLRLTRLPMAEALAYQQACEPRHLDFTPADPGGGHRYAFVRHPAPATLQTLHNFDPDDVLHQALALSRYFALNAHCTDVAARRIEGPQPHPLQITAVLPSNRFYAWRVLDGTRAYLTQRDAEQLGTLLTMLRRDRKRLPPRVWNAIWYCEASFRTYYMEIASVHVVTALESLLKVREHRATAQFVTRVPALARALGIAGMTRRRAKAFYGRRSRSVHGRHIVTTFDPATRELAAMQRLLTAALRKAIEDREFRTTFTGPKIEQRWPVPSR
jgi:hypothetical protein